MTKKERNKEIIENDKKNEISEWEWKKNELNDKNDDNIMILR